MKNPFKSMKEGNPSRKNRVWPILICAEVIILIVLLVACQYLGRQKTASQEIVSASVSATESATNEALPNPTETASVEETTVPAVTEPQILPYLQESAEENSDMVGWIKIDGTKLNYPLMYTPEDEEKYIHKNFRGNYSIEGLPFIDAECTLDPRTDNLIIYGHNMANGKMFATIMNYAEESFWQEHPVIHVYSLYEETAYEVVAAFYDRIYYKHEDAFRFYQFIDAENEEEFNYAMEQFKAKACYDTGVTAEYGDQLITLVTCSYHTDNGRFVVVAKAASNDSEQ